MWSIFFNTEFSCFSFLRVHKYKYIYKFFSFDFIFILFYCILLFHSHSLTWVFCILAPHASVQQSGKKAIKFQLNSLCVSAKRLKEPKKHAQQLIVHELSRWCRCFVSIPVSSDCLWEEHTAEIEVDQIVCVLFFKSLFYLTKFCGCFFLFFFCTLPSKDREIAKKLLNTYTSFRSLNVLNAIYYVHTIYPKIVKISELFESHLFMPTNFIISWPNANVTNAYIHCVWRTELYWVNPVWKHSMHILLS